MTKNYWQMWNFVVKKEGLQLYPIEYNHSNDNFLVERMYE